MHVRVALFALLVSACAYADADDDRFSKAVTETCKKSADEAKGMATRGPTGAVTQFVKCVTSPVDVGGGCKVPCSKPGSVVGE